MEPRRRFRFLKKISEGTFGKVYMSEMITDSNFSKIVAIKVLHGKWIEHEEIVQRSRDEARVLGLLNHRNIIRVEDLTSIKGKCAVIMEYLDGVDLKSLITYCSDRGLTIPLKVILDIIEAVSSAMLAAYNVRPPRGGEPLKLIHRDIKPSNIMLTIEGEVKVLDFGTAQANFDGREAATVALTFGSAGYMAPERLLLDDTDRPSGDIYSLGVSFYELLSLKRFGKINPMREKFDVEIQNRIKLFEEALERYEVDTSVKEAILGVVRQMLSYSHEERPDLQEMLNQMESLSVLVNDGSLRKFCRETVQSCKDSGKAKEIKEDPLAGTIVFEDSSKAFNREEAVEGDISSPIEIDPGVPESTMPIVETNPTPEPEPTVRTTHSEPDPIPSQPEPKKSKIGLFIGIGALLLVGLAVAAVVIVPSMLDKGEQTKTDTKTVVTVKKSGVKGGTFDLKSKDGGKLTLKVRPSSKVELTIQSPRGKKPKFKKKWSTEEEITLSNAFNGTYTIKSSDKSLKTDSTSIKVTEGGNCEYVLKLDSDKQKWSEATWKGDCK
ncbi:MAG: protein kinase [Myxococcota bacterium]|nr:protein kinase [Myxococcota bacterium]